uniref:Spermatogenesis-associated protein 6 N-terminal domain-containing protein n=1 Tax=Kryptolebias marmoratus TaxID=37003 RepID=A0A3Q3A859_KRYMA
MLYRVNRLKGNTKATTQPKVKNKTMFLPCSQVSCPGVRLPTKDDVYLSMCFMGQYSQSECLPAVFPLLVHEKMTFEKIFRYAVDPGDIAVMLECKCQCFVTVSLEPSKYQ